MSKKRLDKVIAQLLNLSRNDAKNIIKKGEIKIDGNIIKKSDTKINAEASDITYNDKTLSYVEHVYIMMNKPENCICSTDKNSTTVLDFLPQHLKRKGLFPVGRLDKDTTGLLLITNDGQFTHNIISPAKNVEKRYLVKVEKPIGSSDEKALKNGVKLKDGITVNATSTKVLNEYEIIIGITEGKYHQVKRMFGAISNKVVFLKRISIGGLQLDDNLQVGQARELIEDEMKLIFNNNEYKLHEFVHKQ